MVQKFVDKYKDEEDPNGLDDDEYLLMDPDASNERAAMSGKNEDMHDLRAHRFISMLDFPVNEMNPYRDPQAALLAQLNESSMGT